MREVGVALLLQRIEGEDDVIGRDRRAVGELRLRSHLEHDGPLVGRNIAAFRDEPVDRVRLVHGARHQAVEQVFEPLRRVALEDEVVEAVERLDAAGARRGEFAALRRVRVDVVEMLEVGGVLQLAERRKPVARLGAGGDREQRCGDGERGETGDDGGVRGDWHCLHRHPHCPRAPASAFCLSASNHQTCDSAEVCDGSVAGRPNTSQ